MPIYRTLAGIEKNFERFEHGFEKFGKHISILAKTSVKREVALLKKIEKERAVVRLLKNDLSHKRKYSDIKLEGIHHLESEIAKREAGLREDEQLFFFGNAFVKSVVGFEKELLGKAGDAACELHKLSTGVQRQIRGLLEFFEQDFKGEARIDKVSLYKKSIFLAEMNMLLQEVIGLSSASLDTSADLENYHYSKSMLLGKVKDFIELDERTVKDALNEAASHHLVDFRRTSTLNNI